MTNSFSHADEFVSYMHREGLLPGKTYDFLSMWAAENAADVARDMDYLVIWVGIKSFRVR